MIKYPLTVIAGVSKDMMGESRSGEVCFKGLSHVEGVVSGSNFSPVYNDVVRE